MTRLLLPKRVLLRFHKKQLEKIDKVIAAHNKCFMDEEVFFTRTAFLNKIIEETCERHRKRINRKLKKLGNTSEMIEK